MRRCPIWARLLVRWLAPRGDADDVLDDLEESHLRRARDHGPVAARALTALETLDMAGGLMRARHSQPTTKGNTIVNDYTLGLRMLLKYPGVTIAGGLALAIAIGIGAARRALRIPPTDALKEA